MKIGLDCSGLLNRSSGAGNYTYSLFKHMLKIDKTDRFVLFFNSFKDKLDPLRTASILNSNRNAYIKSFRFPHRILTFLWHYLNFPAIQEFIGEIDIFHSSDWFFPPTKDAKAIATIHDLTPFKYPEFYLPATLKVHKKKNELNVLKADMIVTISESTKNDIMEFLGIPEDRIRVVHLAPEDSFEKRPDEKTLLGVRQKYNIKKEFILYVGTQEPRKNLLRLIEGYYRLDKNLKGNYDLVIAGREDHPQDIHAELVKRISELRLQDNVTLAGYITQEELVALMYAAALFVFPSLYEGFGMPVLEAMVCGTPVAASNVASLPEIIDNAGIMFDPKDADSIADAIRRILVDEELKMELSERGKKQAALFSWEKAARETLNAYREVLML